MATHHELILALQCLQFSLQIFHLRPQMLIMADYGLCPHQQTSWSQGGDAKLHREGRKEGRQDLMLRTAAQKMLGLNQKKNTQ